MSTPDNKRNRGKAENRQAVDEKESPTKKKTMSDTDIIALLPSWDSKIKLTSGKGIVGVDLKLTQFSLLGRVRQNWLGNHDNYKE
jgi:hypothetical protein